MGSNSFDQAAEEYDEVRPGYPINMFDDLISLTNIPEGGKIIEVGAGTGQATLPIARRGFRITSLEPGSSLRRIAVRNLAPYPKVELLKTSFEDWPLEEHGYDLVISATAFHWVDPHIGYKKAAAALKEGGSLALFWNRHPKPYTGFFGDVQRIYRDVTPEWLDPVDKQRDEDWIEEIKARIEGVGLFDRALVKTYFWSRVYSAEAYIKLLSTYSDHLGLEEHRRKHLFEGIYTLINEKFGGAVTRPYLTVLFIARLAV